MRYVAFLRGVSPMNCRMPELKHCFERAGFTEVKTLLSSGNVVFDAKGRSAPGIERQAEAAMKRFLGRTFLTLVRPVAELEAMIASDPYGEFSVPAAAKRIVTFLPALREPAKPLPLELHGARILACRGREVFSVYLPTPKGPVFMTLIEKTFGSDVTTRTWDTVRKCAEG